ncbi:TPA: hypothetical protein R4X90_004851 [Enterobacter hormaechei subsp. xiangfangensis]|uniref:hypothetical protein n=1 Tax=Enterobacter TaxID=547 RepID=UPI002861A7CF|nr:hypothetical protein [Enterobacter hormaechei]HDW2118765.1 hypothetical protein [Enterobacter hormaechei subsp. xiangfangensis]EMC3976747.1 hypothetical protein [Enterobacter hormaechei]EMD3872921.1 hypothetical protein [Enterobacter hormaechei]MCE1482521.1 hypothetical protein [Enterobacter hormaechei]MDX7136559.1 hypothetical protein [Enterobacter hormaechei]
MAELTKEWLLKTITELEEERDATPGAVNEDAARALEAMKIALASLGAEAVAEVCEGFTLRYIGYGPAPKSGVHIGDRLYTAPPAPVSVLECFKRLLHHAYGMTMGHDWNKGTMAGHHRTKLCQAVEECRAAMLQGADGNSPVIPDGWVLVPQEPTHEMLEAGDEQFGTYDVYRRMIAAAPQWKVK